MGNLDENMNEITLIYGFLFSVLKHETETVILTNTMPIISRK